MGNSWKDLFTFSRKEQGGIAVLLVMLLVLILAYPLIPRFISKEVYDNTEFRRQAELFMAEMARQDSLEQAKKTKPAWEKKSLSDPEETRIHPFYFDPNDISLKELLKLGISESAANNLINYRKKGGSFKKPEDLKKIYGMRPEWYDTLRPYIIIKEVLALNIDKKKELVSTDFTDRQMTSVMNESKRIYLELNTADSSALVQCTGIGPAFSKRIMAYRELLGGFVEKDQLMEVKGMDTSRYQLFKDQVYVDPAAIKKMDINTIDFKEMLRHPYFEYYLVKAIFNFKNEKKGLDSVGELRSMPEIYPGLFKKISPYLEVGSAKEN